MNGGGLFMCFFVRNGKFVSAFSSSAGKYPSSIGSFHSAFETVLISSLSLRRLKCPFHLRLFYQTGLQR
jgi:hypothetical protein